MSSTTEDQIRHLYAVDLDTTRRELRAARRQNLRLCRWVTLTGFACFLALSANFPRAALAIVGALAMITLFIGGTLYAIHRRDAEMGIE